MAPPDEDMGADDGMIAAMRMAQQMDGDSQSGGGFSDEEGYDSTEEQRRDLTRLVTNKRRKKGADIDGEEDLVEKTKEVVGKKQVEKLVDSIAITVEASFLRFLQSDPEIAVDTLRRLELGRKSVWISFSRLTSFDIDLSTVIREDYHRFMPYIDRALERFITILDPGYLTVSPDATLSRPSAFHVSFYDLPGLDRVRDLRTDRLGQLISFTGTVTRSSETRPELLVGEFMCNGCEALSGPIEQEFKYSEPPPCGCGTGSWDLIPNRSIFADWQKVRVQENATEVPAGSMPRSMEVICRYECVEVAKPGDKCVFTGSLIVLPDVAKLRAPGDPPGINSVRGEGRRRQGGDDQGVTGLSSLGVRDLTYRLAFLACSVQPCDGSDMTYDQMDDAGEMTREQQIRRVRETFTDDQLNELEMMARQPHLMEKLRKSAAPAIYGHGDIKLGVLLLLFGGVHKRTPEGINLRGDINVCIVGDPSTAKSQFLRYVCSFDTRAVYTSGKASTAAGLTASVIRDAETGEFCIEAGALMLADNGVCCIDEFDKMDDVDQVAIHEAMEQQTISITKAGIQATLNARTSVLAAANPIHGRYDRSKTLKANLTVGAAIMSRFDLFFVVLDECDEVNDRAIASHILEVHRSRVSAMADDAEESADGPLRRAFFNTDQMRRYVRYARTIDPEITPEVQPLLVECYVKLRQGDSGVGQNKQAYRITVRQLEALIRLSEAIARMHLDNKVRPNYVETAFNLLRTSIVQVESESLIMTKDMEVIPSDISDPIKQHVLRQELEWITTMAQAYVKQREDLAKDDDDFFGVPQTDVVDHVLENKVDLTEDQIDQERQKVNQVLRMLIDTHTVFSECPVPLGWDFAEDTPEEERALIKLIDSVI